MTHTRDILDFWFGAWDDDQPLQPDDPQTRLWWSGAPEADAEVREALGDAYPAARDGNLDDWAKTPRGSLALVILLDQVPRNLHRDTPDAHATDARALQIAQAAVDAGQDRSLRPIERAFLYLPFMHAEDLGAQDRSVALYERLAEETADCERSDYYAGVVDFARKHRAVIVRFGRFPSRNANLGRQSTPEEEAFLAEHGAGW